MTWQNRRTRHFYRWIFIQPLHSKKLVLLNAFLKELDLSINHLKSRWVTHLIMPLIDDKHIKPCRTSQTSNTPPSRKTSPHKHGQICNKLRVKVQVTSDQWPHNSLIIKRNAVTRSLENFFNSELTSVNTNIKGKK